MQQDNELDSAIRETEGSCWNCTWLQWHVALGAGARCRQPNRWSGVGLPPRIPPRQPTCRHWRAGESSAAPLAGRVGDRTG